MQIGVGSVKPRFETTVTIDERDDESLEMIASGGGDASSSSFSMTSGMRIHDLEGGRARASSGGRKPTSPGGSPSSAPA